MDDNLLMLLVPIAVGYLLGSIPFGLIVTRLGGAGDVRKIGSGNIGATNVLRTGRKGLAAATLLLDAGKAFAAVALFWTTSETAMALAGVAAILGHCFPVWLGFKGGKGIACFVGVVAAFGWPLLLVFATVWLGVAYITRYSSLAALCATTASLLMSLIWGSVPISLALLFVTVFAFERHRPNIARLRAGTEGKIGQKG